MQEMLGYVMEDLFVILLETQQIKKYTVPLIASLNELNKK